MKNSSRFIPKYCLRALVLCTALTGFVFIAAAQPNSKLKPTETVLLYPEGQDASIQQASDNPSVLSAVENNGLSGREGINEYGLLTNVSDSARIDLYIPKKPNGQMVVVCPGGGYGFVSSYSEGIYVAEWLVSRGIAAAVVKYRLPNGHWEVPLTDVQNTLRYCRKHASEWGINQIGIIGFSAGGHLAASASNLFTDDITRPDFSILIYPVITMNKMATHMGTRISLIGDDSKWLDKNMSVADYEKSYEKLKQLEDRFSMERQVKENTPPTFIALSQDDNVVAPGNSISYYGALTNMKVPVEMHIYPSGGHGWGFSSEKFAGKGNDGFSYVRDNFENSLEIWLSGLINK